MPITVLLSLVASFLNYCIIMITSHWVNGVTVFLSCDWLNGRYATTGVIWFDALLANHRMLGAVLRPPGQVPKQQGKYRWLIASVQVKKLRVLRNTRNHSKFIRLLFYAAFVKSKASNTLHAFLNFIVINVRHFVI